MDTKQTYKDPKTGKLIKVVPPIDFITEREMVKSRRRFRRKGPFFKGLGKSGR